MDKSVKKIPMAFLIVMVFYLLKILSGIILPLVLALLFAVLFQPLIFKLETMKIPKKMIIPVISVLSLAIIFIIFNIFFQSIGEIFSEQEYIAERLYVKLEQFLIFINNNLSYDLDIKSVIAGIKKFFDLSFVSKTAGNIAVSISSFTGSFIMFAIYYVILLSGMSNYKSYLNYVGGLEKGKHLVEGYETIQKSIFSYLIIKTLISLITGVAAGLVCWALDIRFALIFGLLTFMLNFIPTLGSIIATFPPVIMALVQYDSIFFPLILLLSLIVIQQTMGVIIEPKIVGDRLKIHAIIIILGLVFWSYIWGIPGAFLSVPFMVIMKLICENFESSKVIARMMSVSSKAADIELETSKEV